MAIYVRSQILSIREFETESVLGNAEQVWCGLRFGKDSILIGCFYRRPGINDNDTKQILKTIKRTRERLEKADYGSVVIFGDFNYPGLNWSLEGDDILGSDNEKIFLDVIEDSFLSQCIYFPSFKRVEYYVDGTSKNKESLLDLVLTSEPERVSEILKRLMLINIESGHYTVKWKFSVENQDQIEKKNRIPPIRRANFSAISDDFLSVDWSKELRSLNVDISYKKFYEFCQSTCLKNIPMSSPNSKRKTEPWMIREVKEAVRGKHDTWYRLKKNDSKKEHRRVCKKLKKFIFKAKNNFEKNLAAKSKKDPN